MPDEKDRFDSRHLRYAGLGFEFAGAVALFSFLGYLADQRWETKPYGVAIGGLAGIVIGTYLIVKAAITITQEEDRNH